MQEKERMERLRDCIEELIRLSLHSHINETLKFNLGLSKEFCSNLLRDDPDDPVSLPASCSDFFQGVPRYPLYKHLASALYNSIAYGPICRRHNKKIAFIDKDISFEEKEDEWSCLIQEKGTELKNILKTAVHELHVQEPFFSLLNDGLKTIEGMCAGGDHDRIQPGASILLNKSVMFKVENVSPYASFSEMLEAENLAKVLPGVQTIEEGLKIYRKRYPEQSEMCSGVLALCVTKQVTQPSLILAGLLSGLSYDGVQYLLGLAHTVGTVPDALPPPRSSLLSSFILPYKPNVKGCVLTHGARALAKHAERSSSKYWGVLSGSDSTKNELALNVIRCLMASCHWSNVHNVPQHGAVYEIRVADGYGARWSKDGTKFIGFLEPYVVDGHSKGGKH